MSTLLDETGVSPEETVEGLLEGKNVWSARFLNTVLCLGLTPKPLSSLCDGLPHEKDAFELALVMYAGQHRGYEVLNWPFISGIWIGRSFDGNFYLHVFVDAIISTDEEGWWVKPVFRERYKAVNARA